ncbi:MAG: hypothetical protein AB8H79_25980 [Myxococcota bacterium]
MTFRLLPLFLLGGCLGTPETPAVPDPVDPVAPDVGHDDLGDVDVDPEADTTSRARKRMTIAQVRDSMERVSGGVVWSRDGRVRDSEWNRYTDTLGVPDYIERTEADLTPSVLFQKFIDDAANATCTDWLSRAEAGTNEVFFAQGSVDETDPVRVRADIAALRRRIQGVGQPSQQGAGHDDDLQAYVDLYDLVVVRTDDRAAAWRTVCIGLFTHPDFYAY